MWPKRINVTSKACVCDVKIWCFLCNNQFRWTLTITTEVEFIALTRLMFFAFCKLHLPEAINIKTNYGSSFKLINCAGIAGRGISAIPTQFNCLNYYGSCMNTWIMILFFQCPDCWYIYSPMLTWRDMQHLVVMSANPHNLHADDWVVNGVGRRVSHHFGYGIMNAGKMVELAKNWTNVPQQRVCEIVSSQRNQ